MSEGRSYRADELRSATAARLPRNPSKQLAWVGLPYRWSASFVCDPGCCNLLSLPSLQNIEIPPAGPAVPVSKRLWEIAGCRAISALRARFFSLESCRRETE